VLSIVGSFTDIRGGYVFPEKIMESERKPIRVFLVDGVNDNRGMRKEGKYDPNWDWHHQNVRLADALTKKGYDLNYCWGIGVHGQKQGGMMMPEMMRWLWRDYPRSPDVHDMVERSFHGAPTNAPAADASKDAK
jgi:enterochelin esterase family protein